MSDLTRFYDELAPHYHLLFEDWDAAVRWQGGVLDRLLGRLAGPGRKRVLDAASGIGTQAIGLALEGHAVTGSDLSPASVERARWEAKRLGVEVAFEVADFRDLSRAVAGPFDVVCALDNALPHLESDAELAAALGQMAGLLAPDGLFLASTRDYDALARRRPERMSERVYPDGQGRRRVYQLWDWDANGSGYRVRQHIVREGGVAREPLVFSAHYRALTRAQLSAALEAAGLGNPEWLMPADSGFYQPVVAARRRP
ncbi:MAG: class I SAM-dependent methyltransferase [Rhodospirillales bacterium]|nr:class I SAM-dependent methyltransferase [Rhodospirillales bacterium]MDH3910164.1 class I SAM-dependent methyltransferase [Rhodospirillales bacterium]MDH3966368.1 class I SAM-dependent methyltransferase [Rhodospirillales bacterium]